MKFWVGTTDNEWFRFLRNRGADEVNFWQPRGAVQYNSLNPGSLFLFKLKRPHNHIAGGGYFVKSTSLPMSMAWDTFGVQNGAADWPQFSAMIRKLTGSAPNADPTLGCTVLSNVFFWNDGDWIAEPPGWSGSIVRGRYFDSVETIGEQLWHQVQMRLLRNTAGESHSNRYGEPCLVNPRLGQGAFRVLVTDAYARRCAITGESTLPVLEAAHILPYAESGPHSISNGMLLRSDFHKLFDLGLITVTPDLRVEISSRIKEEFFNGKAYYRLNGHRLANLPAANEFLPAAAYLQWHNENRFRA